MYSIVRINSYALLLKLNPSVISGIIGSDIRVRRNSSKISIISSNENSENERIKNIIRIRKGISNAF